MPTQINLGSLRTPFYRHQRFVFLLLTLEKIAFFKMYNGAYVSTSMDFDGAYNSAYQCEKNGGRARSQEDVGKHAYNKLASAQEAFKTACSNCEFVKSCCRGKEDQKKAKEDIFWQLVDDSKVRNRFRDRIRKRDVQEGLKSIPCTRLLQKAIIKKDEWTTERYENST